MLGFGGLALACSFFMPVVPVCNSPIVPAEEVWSLAQQNSVSLGDLVAVFALFVVAYFFGLLALIIALRGRSYRHKTEKSLGISVPFLFGILVVLIVMGTVVEILTGSMSWELGYAILGVIAFVSLGYYLRSLRMGVSGLLCLRWYVGLCCVVWFGNIFVCGVTYYGLWLSLFGAICIVVASFAEAQIRSRLGFRTTLWDLLRCRLKLYDLDGPRCFECGYLLVGLTSDRCPECGRPFSWADYGVVDGQAAMHYYSEF